MYLYAIDGVKRMPPRSMSAKTRTSPAVTPLTQHNPRHLSPHSPTAWRQQAVTERETPLPPAPAVAGSAPRTVQKHYKHSSAQQTANNQESSIFDQSDDTADWMGSKPSSKKMGLFSTLGSWFRSIFS